MSTNDKEYQNSDISNMSDHFHSTADHTYLLSGEILMPLAK